MAGTYYKYAERQADSQVNWFQVGKDMTDMLKKETELREQKKAAIDEASRQFGQELENAPTGNADDVNEWTTNFAADMQEYRLMTDRLLKSGRLNPKNYTLIRQNSLDGTKNLFSLSKEYQAEYEEKMKRKNENISSAAEGQFMAMVEGFANLKQTKPLINPTNGAISVGRMERGPDGVMRLKEGPDNYMTVNQLRNRIKEKVDKYKLNEDLQGEVKMMGEVVNEIVMKTGSATETGFLQKITDPTLRKGLAAEGQQAVNTYLKLESDIVKAKLTNPKNVSSVLFDWAGVDPKTGKAYQVVTDPKVAETSSHYVLWTYKDGLFQPDFETTKHGKEQYKQAEQYVKTKLRGMLEQKSELDPFSQPRKEQPPQQQEWQAERADRQRQQASALSLWNQLFSGATTGAKETAKQGLLGTPQAIQQGLLDIDMSDGKTIKLKYDNPKLNREIKIVDASGRPITGDQFAAAGIELHGVTDRAQFSKFANQKFANQGVDFRALGGGRQGTPVEQPAKPKVVARLTSGITDDLFKMKSQKASTTLGSLLSVIPGAIVQDKGGAFRNDVEITLPGLPVYKFNANLSAKEIPAEKTRLINFIKGAVSEDKAKKIIKELEASGGGELD